MDTRSAAGSQTKGREELALLESGLRPRTVDDCLCELLRATTPGDSPKEHEEIGESDQFSRFGHLLFGDVRLWLRNGCEEECERPGGEGWILFPKIPQAGCPL